jgi:hypothetical protein
VGDLRLKISKVWSKDATENISPQKFGFPHYRYKVLLILRSKNGKKGRVYTGVVWEITTMLVCELKEFILNAIDDELQPGGDLELWLPSLGEKLVGHHDGIYWLEG